MIAINWKERKLMFRYVKFVALLAILAAVLATPAIAQDEYDCEDFSTQQEAQATFNQDTSDPYGLDEGPGADDGKACESLPSSTDPNQQQVPLPEDQENSPATAQYEQYQYGEYGQTLPSTGGPNLLVIGVVGAFVLLLAIAFVLGSLKR